jgi:predicted enzyme related to lactoylglutathione lyase
MPHDESESRVFGRAGISYLRIPADDPQESAVFYQGVFGWTVDMRALSQASRTAPGM